MLYLSAQPDDFYYTWQIELQIFNLRRLGVPPSDIHILIAYDERKGLQDYFKELFEKNNSFATFFTYADRRVKPAYVSSVRPHIIAQHYLAHPWLEKEAIFYFDSDVIFRALPDFEGMLKDDIWYVSDTRNYLDSQYINRFGGVDLLESMCKAVGIDPKTVVQNDANAGGAQYLLKKCSAAFWGKVEIDSEALYVLMQSDNNREANRKLRDLKKLSSYHGIQTWCADMWSILWNAIYFDQTIRISAELNFCWADSKIQDWHACKILHYSKPPAKCIFFLPKDRPKLASKNMYGGNPAEIIAEI